MEIIDFKLICSDISQTCLEIATGGELGVANYYGFSRVTTLFCSNLLHCKGNSSFEMILTMLVLKVLTICKARNRKKKYYGHILTVVLTYEVRKLPEFILKPQIYRFLASMAAKF